jgi:fatty-acyl-CoA synthase
MAGSGCGGPGSASQYPVGGGAQTPPRSTSEHVNGYSTFDWPATHARRRPDAVAVTTVDTGFELTWLELDTRVGRLAHLLAERFGIQREDRIALIAASDARYFEVQFALFRLGAIFVPLNIRLAAAELAAMADDAGVRLLIHDPANAALSAQVGSLAAAPTLQWDEGPPAGPYDAVRDPGARSIRAHRIAPDAIAQIMYTSGTTGKPKGVIVTHGQMAANAVNMAHACRCADRDAHALNYVPLFHAGGLNIYCMPVLYWGGRVTTTKGFDPQQALDLLTDASLGATVTNGVLQMYERIAQLEGFAEARFPTMRVMLFGGFGPTAPQTHRLWLGKGPVVVLGYGSTELGPMTCMNEDPDDQALLRGAFGRPVPVVEVRCVDDGGTVLPTGETGEIQVRGPAITSGYWGRGRDGFSPDDWFSIGDVGYFDLDGAVHITGRLVERYRSGGENIYPAEIESAYVDLPGVVELAVIGVPDDRWGEVGLLAIVPEPGFTFTLDGIRQHAEGKLARFKLPQHLQILTELPRSTTLKVARNELRTRFAEGRDR